MSPISIPILYEDNHILVIEKPVNVPTQQDRSLDADLTTLLKQDLKVRYNKPGNVYLGLVHRLDRPVGGVMVFAKTSKAASRLSDLIRRRRFDKTYLAVVHGRPQEDTGQLTHSLWKDEASNVVHVVPPSDPRGKQALLTYACLSQYGPYTLVQIDLITGRSHQIRVQFAAIDCPLFGDQKYGAAYNKVGQQLALWSHRLTFMHPTLRTEMTFESRPPDTHPWNDSTL